MSAVVPGNDQERLAAEIAAWRRGTGRSAKQLAREAEVSDTAIRLWETCGKRITPVHLERLAALGMPRSPVVVAWLRRPLAELRVDEHW